MMDLASKEANKEMRQKGVEYEQTDSTNVEQPENSHNIEVKFQAESRKKLDEYLDKVANVYRSKDKT